MNKYRMVLQVFAHKSFTINLSVMLIMTDGNFVENNLLTNMSCYTMFSINIIGSNLQMVIAYNSQNLNR